MKKSELVPGVSEVLNQDGVLGWLRSVRAGRSAAGVANLQQLHRPHPGLPLPALSQSHEGGSHPGVHTSQAGGAGKGDFEGSN